MFSNSKSLHAMHALENSVQHLAWLPLFPPGEHWLLTAWCALVVFKQSVILCVGYGYSSSCYAVI